MVVKINARSLNHWRSPQGAETRNPQTYQGNTRSPNPGWLKLVPGCPRFHGRRRGKWLALALHIASFACRPRNLGLVEPNEGLQCLAILTKAHIWSLSLPRDQLLRSFWPGPFGQLCCGRPHKFSETTSQATVKICKCEWCVWFPNGWTVYISCVYFWTICVVGLPRKSSNDICISSPVISLLYAYP